MFRVIMMSTACVLVCFQSLGAQTVVRRDTTIQTRLNSIYQVIGSKNGLAGLTVSSATSPRDTNGLLISAVTPGSPAEKAGLAEGNRIAAVNGVNLKLHPADAGQTDMQGIMARRFQREMAKVRLGDSLKLNVYADSRYRDVTVRTELPQARKLSVLNTSEDMNRATLGAIVGGTATKRDTLGVLVLEIAENGPLAKNSIYEGSRIASIGGVDLRVPVASAGDAKISSEKADLLVSELGKLSAGNRVELRVYDSGRYRNVSVETMRRGDVTMPPGSGGIFKLRGGGGDNLMHLNQLELPNVMLHLDRLNLDSTLQQIRRHVIEVPRVDRLEMEQLHESLKGMDLIIKQNLDTLRMQLPLIINGRRIAASE